MGKWAQTSPEKVKRYLATVWANPDEPKQYHVLRDILKKMPELRYVSERTILRYLNTFVKTGFLTKTIEETHKTWYSIKNQDEYQKILIENEIWNLPLTLTPTKMPLISPAGTGATQVCDESPTVKQWEPLLTSDFMRYYKKQYPELMQEPIKQYFDFFMKHFFTLLEGGMKLNVFSDLPLPPVDASHRKVLRQKIEKGFYAKIWAHIFEAVALLLFGVYKQCGDFETFMEKCRDGKIMFTVEASLPLGYIHDTIMCFVKEDLEAQKEELKAENVRLKSELSNKKTENV
ncbi:MAG: hypothetical protein ACKD6O_08290 [Candidatus Bathyarchaeota archaeon]